VPSSRGHREARVLVHATPTQAAAIEAWDLWAMTKTALEDLERRFHFPALAAGDAATDDGLKGFRPIE